MGGGTAKKTQADYNQEVENDKRAKLMARDRMKNEGTARKMEYQQKFREATGGAQRTAEAGVTTERSEGIAKYSKMRTDFNAQERRRLFEAKKGTGQVDAGDTRITGKMMKEGQEFLDRDSEYWDTKRKAAGAEAYGKGEKGFLAEYGDEEAYAGKGELATAARENGQTYTPRQNPDGSYKSFNMFNQEERKKFEDKYPTFGQSDMDGIQKKSPRDKEPTFDESDMEGVRKRPPRDKNLLSISRRRGK